MSNQQQRSSDEIDLNYLLGSIKGSFKSVLRTLFSAFDFLVKYWYILVLLVIIGAGTGYFLQQSQERNRAAKILVQVNFDGSSYVYNAIDLLQKKIDQGDRKFLTSLGLDKDKPELVSVSLTPVVRIQDIVTRFDVNNDNRSLESVLKNVEFEGDDDFQLSQTFDTAYKYHVLEVEMLPKAKKEVLNGIMTYLNSNEAMKSHKDATVLMLTDQLNNNNKIIEQIDQLITDLRTAATTARTGNAAYIVEKDDDLDQLVRSKIEIEKENRLVRQELLETADIAVPMTALEIFPASQSITDRKHIFLPLLLVGGFLLTAFVLFAYRELRAIAYSEDA
ncbi:MAG: hypothetical protein ABJM06_10845 [Gilvibacter sp.]